MSLLILVADDEADQREMLKGFLENQGFRVVTAASGAEAVRLFEDLPLQLVLLDHRMPDMNGDEVLARIKEINPMTRAIMITAYGAVDTAVRVMKLGADDFLEKPVDLAALLEKILAIEQDEQVRGEAEAVAAEMETGDLPVRLVGRGRAMRSMLSLVRRVAPAPWTVLVRGETGTGKELVANLIHLLSPRRDAPFVTINCAAIPENLFESELFGHEKGAFTGAERRKMGRFEQAKGGTLFLDEIGELPLGLQAKLLRALQEKTITRVGGIDEIPVDVRLVAATNRDLRAMAEQGGFREDLFYRLHVLEIEVPPLRRRKEDVRELAEYFLKRFGRPAMKFAPETLALLGKYSFPGNVRELEHIVQRMATLARGTLLGPEELPAELRRPPVRSGGSLDERLRRMEAEMIRDALERNGMVQTRAAEELGVSERVLRYKMEKLGLKGRRRQ